MPEPELTGSAGGPCEEEEVEDGGVPPHPSQAGIPGLILPLPGVQGTNSSGGPAELLPAGAEPRDPPPAPACPGRMRPAPPLPSLRLTQNSTSLHPAAAAAQGAFVLPRSRLPAAPRLPRLPAGEGWDVKACETLLGELGAAPGSEGLRAPRPTY